MFINVDVFTLCLVKVSQGGLLKHLSRCQIKKNTRITKKSSLNKHLVEIF